MPRNDDMPSPAKFLLLLPLVVLLSGCTSGSRLPIATVLRVDLPRFMGDWYVIAHIPTFIEKNAYDAVESDSLQPDGTIAMTLTFRAGGPDGPAKRYTPGTSCVTASQIHVGHAVYLANQGRVSDRRA